MLKFSPTRVACGPGHSAGADAASHVQAIKPSYAYGEGCGFCESVIAGREGPELGA